MNPQIGFLLNKALEALRTSHLESADLYLRQAIKLQSNNPHALRLLGVVAALRRQYPDALNYLNASLKSLPKNSLTLSNLGNVFLAMRDYQSAIEAYDKSIKVDSKYEEAYLNKGIALNKLKCYDEAIIYFEKALSINSNIDWIYGDLIHIKMKLCFWEHFQVQLDELAQKVQSNQKIAQPLVMLSLTDDVFLHKQFSNVYAKSKHPLNPALGPIPRSSKKEKIRIGYFSADFRSHPVSTLTAELFELHDKNQFETIAFSFSIDDESPMRLRLSLSFSQFMDVSNMSDDEIARLARDLGIDIAVDLGGFTAENRAGIFSYRAAPIQISYIGFLGTMSTEYIDYILADNTIIPEEFQQFYSEKIAYLPSYQANDRKRVISDKKFTRQELGLPEDGFIFCCFNSNYKILPETFSSWMRILKATEGSILFLYVENRWAENNLKQEAAARGVDSKRLVFAGHLPAHEYLARYRTCNLFLDTFPYNAGTTASDALWSGLPVLTLMGESFASRVAASLLNAIGLPELITSTKEGYEALAIELAINPNKLADIKLKLAKNRLTTPLFDTPIFTKNLESIYIKMYERHQADLRPEHIAVT